MGKEVSVGSVCVCACVHVRSWVGKKMIIPVCACDEASLLHHMPISQEYTGQTTG